VSTLAGIHAVREALRAGRALERVLVARGTGGPRIQEIIELCRQRSIPVRFQSLEALDRVSGQAAHQGVAAVGAAVGYAGLDEVASASSLMVILDGVEDPHNLGAVIRTAHAAGAGAVIIPERRAVGLTEAAAKAAAGALEHLPVVRVVNINRTLAELKKRGYWVYGFDERGPERYDRARYHAPAAFVFGGEGRGLHQQVRQSCDFLVRIPLAGKIASLNVSVAAGVALFEWKRQRGGDEET